MLRASPAPRSLTQSREACSLLGAATDMPGQASKRRLNKQGIPFGCTDTCLMMRRENRYLRLQAAEDLGRALMGQIFDYGAASPCIGSAWYDGPALMTEPLAKLRISNGWQQGSERQCEPLNHELHPWRNTRVRSPSVYTLRQKVRLSLARRAPRGPAPMAQDRGRRVRRAGQSPLRRLWPSSHGRERVQAFGVSWVGTFPGSGERPYLEEWSSTNSIRNEASRRR